MLDRPFAPAAARNAEPIAAVLQQHFSGVRHVLEVGSGTGQHAVHFARAMPWLSWQCSDVAANLPGIRAWLDEAALSNTPPPLALDVNDAWPPLRADGVFSANTLHIMSWQEVERLFAQLEALLLPTATVVIYGPFRKDGRHTAPSNAAFEAGLQADAPWRGIRDMADIDRLAAGIGLRRVDTVAMPANNVCLVWRRHPAA